MVIEQKEDESGDRMDSLKENLGKAERIGVIGSPSSTSNLTIDILGTAVNKRLVGNLSVFSYNQDGNDHYALGQIVEIEMKNVWTQDPTMRGLIRHKGRVDPITERQDTHTASMTVSSVFEKKADTLEQSIFGTVPSTGTPIKLLSEDIMDSLLHSQKEELFYLGKAYGTNIRMPMWFKHFGTGKHGAGEAYHLGVFGKTGSGKSVLARMIMMGYARHRQMSIFILDPQGEFSKNLKEESESTKILREKLDRKVEVFDLHNLVLTGSRLLKQVLVNSGFLEQLGIYQDTNRWQAADQIDLILSQRGRLLQEITPWNAHKREAFDRVWAQLQDEDVLRRIYTMRDLRDRILSTLQTSDPDVFYEQWKAIMNLFKYEGKRKAIKINDLVAKIHNEEGLIVVIDLSETNIPEDLFWNEMTKLIVIGEFIDKITKEAEKKFKNNELLNGLIIIDEAHRLAPRERTDNEDLERIKEQLIDAVRTTRKYGLGWMFISQTLSSLHREIINQTRIYIFGFGLGWGIERQALNEIIGGQREAMALYQRFRDPQSSIGEKVYSFMTVGPISPLSFSGTPLFFNALRYPEEFLGVNFDN